MLDVLTWIALAAGIAASSAALYGHYRVLPGWLTGPEICRLEDGGCAVLFRSPRSRLLGVPNAALGIALYVLLAIGDGLVAQVPALVISTAAGLIVSRVGKGEHTGAQLLGQLVRKPHALVIAAAILGLLGTLALVTHSLPLALAGVLACGLGFANVWPLVFSMTVERQPERTACVACVDRR